MANPLSYHQEVKSPSKSINLEAALKCAMPIISNCVSTKSGSPETDVSVANNTETKNRMGRPYTASREPDASGTMS